MFYSKKEKKIKWQLNGIFSLVYKDSYLKISLFNKRHFYKNPRTFHSAISSAIFAVLTWAEGFGLLYTIYTILVLGLGHYR